MDISEVLHNELTDKQRLAVLDSANEILCLACAGSGKSRTLAYRIARLLADEETPESIVAFTFTEKASETIKRRVATSLIKVGISPEVIGAMYIGTIHSFCKNILGEIDATKRQYDVLDDNRLKLYLISRFYELGLKDLYSRAGDKYFKIIQKVADAWKTLNDEMIDINSVNAQDEQLGTILRKLNECLSRDQFIDFSLMIRNVLEAFQNRGVERSVTISNLRHLMVDEYQDVSPAQEELIRYLHERSRTLFVVGDDDQSIYAWRGADVSNILTFESRYPHANAHTLSENFRSTDAIVKSSDAFVSAELGPSRITKNPISVNNRAPRDFRILWFNSREEEAGWIAERIERLLGASYEEPDGTIRGLTPADFAILMRSTREPEQDDAPRHYRYTQALNNKSIHFSLEAGGGPFDREQVRMIRDTFELLRAGSPNRTMVQSLFNTRIRTAYPNANFARIVNILTEWGRLIHTPPGGTRRRVYPQKLVHEVLESFGIAETNFPDEVMRDIGLFSKMVQDIETVYMSVDSPSRFKEILNFLNNAAETGYDVSTDDLLQRPDAVTVSTVHKSKGLEYPVVFVVDVEDGRFPAKRQQYDGWLPNNVIQPAINRGAYQRSPNEEARLFYTAITRAERYLYITGAQCLPGGKSVRKTSSYVNRLNHPELSNALDTLPDRLTYREQQRRIDETILPTSFSEIRYYLRCPMDYRFRYRYGFTPFIPDMFGFGKTVHTTIEKLHEIYRESVPSIERVEGVVQSTFHLKHVPQSKNPNTNPGPYERAKNKSIEIARQYVQDYSQDFQRRKQVEARFEIPAQNCLITGSIDLLLREDNHGNIIEAEVIDFKAIEGGDNPESSEILDWTELALQVQLYVKAAQEIWGENAKTGSVHLLKDNIRVEVPISDEAIICATRNVEWAVQGIIANDYPMRPHSDKCSKCDFSKLCPAIPQNFNFTSSMPPELFLPGRREHTKAFSQFTQNNV